jgi:hypothetical protein
MAIDYTTDQFSQVNGFSLSFTRDITEPINERHVGLVEELGGRFDCFIDSGGLPIN